MATPERLDVAALRSLVVTFSDAVRQHAERLNLLNVYPVPDGDTGTNMARTLEAVVEELSGAAASLEATCDAISHGSLMGARGNSGVILSQILRGISTTFRAAEVDEAAAGRRFADSLAAASAGAYQAVLKPVEGTILTVVRESAEAAGMAADAGAALVEVVEAAHTAGRDALARTPDLLPVLRDAGVVDAGGAGFLLYLDAALHVLTGRPVPVAETPADPADPPAPSPVASGVDGPLDVSEQRYEVMFFCHLDDAQIGSFKQAWGVIGDSIAVVGGDGLWNCHVHTNDIGAAIETALDLGGRPHRIRVTDLFDEVAEEHAARDRALEAAAGGSSDETSPVDGIPTVPCAVVAVASGDGLTTLFRDLGASEVVTGGQTANPSTAELLAAVDRTSAEAVIVLPNNKNIIAVAELLDGLTSRSVLVVPTRSMPEALAALVVFDPRADGSENHAAMVDAIGSVASGEVTRAVRDSRSEVGAIREGDWIGLVAGQGIASVADDLLSATTGLLECLLGPDRELLTIVTGADARPDETERLIAWLADDHGDVEVDVHHGGQPLYPYLFGVE